MASLADLIDRLFQRFVLRDILGVMFPGFLVWVALAVAFFRDPAVAFVCQGPVTGIQCLSEITQNLNATQALLIAGLSYVAGWSLFCLHLVVVDTVHAIGLLLGKGKSQEKAWTRFGVFGSWRAIASGSLSDQERYSLVTLAALAPDRALKRLTPGHDRELLQQAQAYTERSSALLMFSVNMALVTLIWSAVLGFTTPVSCWALLGLPGAFALYHEYWRLLFARNLRMEYFIDAANAVGSQSVTPQAYLPE